MGRRKQKSWREGLPTRRHQATHSPHPWTCACKRTLPHKMGVCQKLPGLRKPSKAPLEKRNAAPNHVLLLPVLHPTPSAFRPCSRRLISIFSSLWALSLRKRERGRAAPPPPQKPLLPPPTRSSPLPPFPVVCAWLGGLGVGQGRGNVLFFARGAGWIAAARSGRARTF